MKRSIIGWNNMKNNAIPSESKIKTVFKPIVEETTTTSTTTTTTTEEEVITTTTTTSTTTETTTIPEEHVNTLIEIKQYDKIVIVGAGVAGINAATKLVDNGYPGQYITIIDKGNDPHNRLPEEVMTGMLGAGGWSDGKLTYHTEIGGQLSKYCGEEKAMELMDQVISNFRRFHPKPEEIFMSDPKKEPKWIKPHFGLRMFPVWHIGSNFLHEIAKAWYQYLVDKGVHFEWNTEIYSIDFNASFIRGKDKYQQEMRVSYDTLIFAVGKSGIDFAQQLADDYKLPNEPKAVQIGVRFEAPQKYFQKLIDISYDFKLYQKFDNVSLRTFCTNNNAAYVAVEETYGDVSYNGHAKKGKEFENGMTNFGILMEIKGIDNPFDWSRTVVSRLQVQSKGVYYSPSRTPSLTSEGVPVSAYQLVLDDGSMDDVRDIFGGYFKYIDDFINQMNQVFKFGDDWGMYIPEVKYAAAEPLTNYSDLSLINYPNIHFVGDALSARGITVSGAQAIYVAESILRK
jgi:uncharacterized FAD-dependent dehydrogenase